MKPLMITVALLMAFVWLLWAARYFGVRMRNRRVYHRCPTCGYLKRGSVSETCPECGSPWGDGAQIPLPSLGVWLAMPVKKVVLYVLLPVVMLILALWTLRHIP
ncbi:MAG: hypothetical protein AAGI37_04975 [Planctomycetota bacterium]